MSKAALFIRRRVLIDLKTVLGKRQALAGIERLSSASFNAVLNVDVWPRDVGGNAYSRPLPERGASRRTATRA